MKNLPIGVFDSGIGGLTVVKALTEILPHESIIYFGDLAHLPYGSKGRNTVKKLSLESAEFLYRKGIKLLVVACNTATSIALEDIEKTFDIPVIGVIEPGAEEAVRQSENKKIGVIGTTRTIVSNAYYDVITQKNPAERVFQLATPLLVPLIEEGWIGHPSFYLILEEYLKFFNDKEIDSIVLGCTHYPLIKENLRLLRPHIKIVDSAMATARSVEKTLQEKNSFSDSLKAVYEFYASDISETFIDLSEKIMGKYVDIKLT
ncbi:MAG TPA: glutamate racemase [Spirochaetia bacterium]|nr:MAG: glutamate racemase [Spirochaetes bacterium GWB1_36_13]HCL55757.1 glutamate racemase [Spirochaetia bacterium]